MAPKFAQTPVLGPLTLTDNTETEILDGTNVAGTMVDWIRVYAASGETATNVIVLLRETGSLAVVGYVMDVTIVPGEVVLVRLSDLVLPDGWSVAVAAVGTVAAAVFVCVGGAELG